MEYPWFREYKVCGIPKTLEPYPDVPTHFFLDRAAKEFPRMGCVQMGLEMPYPEVKDHADRLAGALKSFGVEKGDRVATLLPTSIQFVVVDAGISKAGAVHVPGNLLESRDALGKKYSECLPKILICLDEHIQTALTIKENTDISIIIVTKLDDYSSQPSPCKPVEGALWLSEIIEQAQPNPPKVIFDSLHDLETLLFTGGTTGVPKGCMLTHRNIVANAHQNLAMMGLVNRLFIGNVSVIMALPFSHSYGHSLMHTMICSCFNLLIVVDPRDTKGMIAMIKKYHPIFQVGVPTQFMNMLGEDLKKTKLIGISGSAALPPNVQEKFEKSSGGYITEGYGLSELSPATHYNVSANIKVFGGRMAMRLMNPLLFNPVSVILIRAGSKVIGYKMFGNIFTSIISFMSKLWQVTKVSKGVEKRANIGIPIPDTEVRVVEVDSGIPISLDELVRDGKVGELCLKGPQRMLGYWPDPGKGMDEDGFVHTGDVVKMDENGYFSIVDRTKDMVIISGYKVYTREIDDLLYDHPATKLAASIGVPDPDRAGSERIIVFIQLREEYQGKVTPEEYMNFLTGKVAKYAVPRSISFLNEIPLTSVLKVDKKLLREMAAKK